jgi:hypothetical protein
LLRQKPSIIDHYTYDIAGLSHNLRPHFNGFTQFSFINSIRQLFHNSGSIDFDILTTQARGCEATKPQDKVFGILGLVDLESIGVIPDYFQPVRRVFIDAAKAMIRQRQSLTMLSACQHPERPNGLPSWVPDLTVPAKAPSLCVPQKYDLYNAAKGTAAEYRFTDAEGLILKGLCFDTIHDLGPTYDSPGDPKEMLELWRQIALKTMARKTPQMGIGEMFDAYWRTLITDQKDDNTRATSDLGRAYSPSTRGISRPQAILDYGIPPADFRHEYNPIWSQFIQSSGGRRFCGTRKGHIGLVVPDAHEGDLVCVLLSAHVPFVLRKEADHYVVVGEACKIKTSPFTSFISLQDDEHT